MISHIYNWTANSSIANITQFDGSRSRCTSNNGHKMHGPIPFSYCINGWGIINGVTESFVQFWVIPITVTSCTSRPDATSLIRCYCHLWPRTIITFITTDKIGTLEFECLRWSISNESTFLHQSSSLRKGKT